MKKLQQFRGEVLGAIAAEYGFNFTATDKQDNDQAKSGLTL